MKDLIDRRTAIDAVLDRMDVEKYGRNAKPEEIQWALEKLPPAQSELQWIPCNETVDIPDYEVLACDKYGGMIIGYLVYDEQWICESETEFMYDPLAWKPLPKPYKEEKHG